jgi:deazaflavin-dependent oxidoreductase (nitroreductase family)
MGKVVYQLVMAVFVGLYRLTGGKIGGDMRGFPVLLLSTVGRKTGKKRVVMLGLFEVDSGYVVIASNNGLDAHPGWYFNLKASPRAKIQILDRRLDVIASVAGPAERPKLWARLMELAPGYGDYTTKTKREIPLVILRPEPVVS